MLRKLLYIVVITATIFGTSCQKESVAPVQSGNPNAPLNPERQKLLDLVNDLRGAGCNCGGKYFPPAGPVTWSTQLEQAAKKHSEYMNSTGDFSHTGAGGSDAGDRIDAEGYNWTTYGENIADGYATEEEVIEAWRQSPGHCANIMNPDFKEMGVATSGTYWTQVFASRN